MRLEHTIRPLVSIKQKWQVGRKRRTIHLCNKDTKTMLTYKGMKGLYIVFTKPIRYIQLLHPLSSKALPDIGLDQSLNNNHIAPHTIKFSMLFMHTNLAKSK